jgi:pimeloyl-ACP methyl ester carboxylesterase
MRSLLLLPLALLLAGCATPVGVDRASPREVQRELTRSALTSGRPSAPTRELLTRLDLYGLFERDPDAAIAALHADLAPTGDLDRLFALAELSFLAAEADGRRDHALAAAVYAFAFLFGEGGVPVHPFDPRIQLARGVYNRGLTLGLADARRENVAVESARHALPFGVLDVRVAPDATDWFGWRLERFRSAADFRVRGLRNRYRQPGIGAPLSASLDRPEGAALPPGADFLPPRLRVPVTAFLRIDDVRAQLASGQVIGRLELYPEDRGRELLVDGQAVPRELEKSSSLAAMLEGSPIWSYGFAGFRLGDFLPDSTREQLVMLHPYQPGQIPLVLVHGTFSSPATWAELVNELQNDPEISPRFQPWLFLYPTGNPIAYSGGVLAETLRAAVATLDPEGRDPALHRMVVVGHSQGGMLTRLLVVDSGDRFWRNVSRRPLEDLGLAPESEALLRRSLFFTPQPFVGRVVFMATPHGGSYLSDFRVASWISRLVKAPATLTKLLFDVVTVGGDEFYLRNLDRPPTSLDNMASRNPFLRTLRELPIAPGVPAHSIIAVRGGPPPEGRSDGVVRFESAHIEGVESELIVDSGHSVQMQQRAIQELRRILLEHAGAASGAEAAGSGSAGGLPEATPAR